MSGKLLFIGDVHLGRRPLRVPEGRDANDLGPTAAWKRCVDIALREEVAAVVFAGDVVESVENRFEAERVLRPGIEELIAAGIRVLAVAGNHDVNALPRLADRLEGFELIGRGAWESVVIESEGSSFCRLHGWSFVEQIERENPLDALSPDVLDPSLPNIGLLHCDRDGSASSRYAPVPSSAFLQSTPGAFDAWFLGHVHRPDHEGLTAERPLGYLGSLVALDGGELGPHGPWLVTVAGRGRVQARQLLIGPIRWEEFEVAVDDMQVTDFDDRVDDLRSRIQAAMDIRREELGDEADRLLALACRVRLVGRVERPEELRRAVARLDGERDALATMREGLLLFCDKLEARFLPKMNLAERARQRGAIAALARLLLEPDESVAVGLRARLEPLLRESVWSELDEIDSPASAERIAAAGRELLGRMLAQLEEGS